MIVVNEQYGENCYYIVLCTGQVKLKYDCLSIFVISEAFISYFLSLVKQFQNNSIIYHGFFKIISYDKIGKMQ